LTNPPFELPLLVSALDRALRITNQRLGNIQLIDWKAGYLEIVAQQGFQPDFLDCSRRVTSSDSCASGRALLAHLDEPDWFKNAELEAQLRSVLEPLAAYYFLKARTPKGRLIDSVARFHLGNGARLERIDWLGDVSPKGLRESAGIMVNYLYRLEDIEKNHEAFANRDEIAASSAVKKLLKNEGRRLLDMRLS